MYIKHKNSIQFILAFLIVNLADAATTHYIIDNQIGTEINPFIDTATIFSMLVAPLNIGFFVTSLIIVVMLDRNHSRSATHIHTNGFLLFISTLPYFNLFSIAFAVLNNLLIIFGFNGQLSWFVGLFGENEYFGLVVAYIILAMIFLPFVERYVKRLYPLVNEEPE